MQVKDLMTHHTVCCDAKANLAAAAVLMYQHDCGVLPVTENGKLTGIITDRDICIALATRSAKAHDVPVGEVAHRELATCLAHDHVKTALATMKRERVRRLPVVSESGEVKGMLSLNDLILASKAAGPLTHEEVIDTLKIVSAHRT